MTMFEGASLKYGIASSFVGLDVFVVELGFMFEASLSLGVDTVCRTQYITPRFSTCKRFVLSSGLVYAEAEFVKE